MLYEKGGNYYFDVKRTIEEIKSMITKGFSPTGFTLVKGKSENR